MPHFDRGVRPLGAPRAASRKNLDGLTERETEVLALVGQPSNAEIAAHLVVAEQTVKTRVSRILMEAARCTGPLSRRLRLRERPGPRR